MTDPAPQPDIQRMLQGARRQASRLPQGAGQLADRLPDKPLWTRITARQWTLAGVAGLLVGLAVGLLHLPGPSPADPADPWRQEARFEMGPSDVVIHLAAVVDERTVAVVWSRPRQADTLEPALPVDGPGSREVPLVLEDQPAGRRAYARLYIAPEGLDPVLQPPAIRLALADGGQMNLSVSCQPAPSGRGLPLALSLHGRAALRLPEPKETH